MTEKYCEDCYFMVWVDEETKEEMDCANGNAIPGIDGVPGLIVSDPHNCPFYTEKEGDLND